MNRTLFGAGGQLEEHSLGLAAFVFGMGIAWKTPERCVLHGAFVGAAVGFFALKRAVGAIQLKAIS